MAKSFDPVEEEFVRLMADPGVRAWTGLYMIEEEQVRAIFGVAKVALRGGDSNGAGSRADAVAPGALPARSLARPATRPSHRTAPAHGEARRRRDHSKS